MGDGRPHQGGVRGGRLTAPDWASTVDALLRARAGDPHVGLVAGEERYSWAELVAQAAARAAWFAGLDRPAGPPHVGVLLPNRPEFVHWLGAAALGRFAIVGLNPVRPDGDLAQDVRETACAVVVTDAAGAARLAGHDLGGARVVVSDDPTLAPAYPEVGVADLEGGGAAAEDLFVLVFTSGTTGRPKAVRCSQGKIAWSAQGLVLRTGLTAEDVAYVSMPLFHSNAVIAGWGPALACGATVALRERFSASQFLGDVRRYGATYANYVGTPLSYVLAQPERADDADNPLRLVFGNEGAPADLQRFGQRFGCVVIDGFGSSEGGISISRTPETPPGALGLPNGDVRVLDPQTGAERPRAVFDAQGRLANADEAVGELVNCDGAGMFEGYWGAPEEDAVRLRDGRYWSGDLGYRDEAGFLYFAGRAGDRLRVGGENFPGAPLVRLLVEHPAVVEAVVYALPDPAAGDVVAATLVLRDEPGSAAERVTDVAAWFAGQAPEPWWPRFVRVLGADEVPRTATGKVVVRDLARRHWDGPDVWWRPGREPVLQPFDAAAREGWEARFAASGRALPG